MTEPPVPYVRDRNAFQLGRVVDKAVWRPLA